MFLETSLLFLTITSFFISPAYADFDTAKEHNRPVIQLVDTYSFHPYTIEEKTNLPIYDIPLSKELQEYVYKTSSEYNIEYELMLSVMWVETGGKFKYDLVSETKDYGLMQINKVNHKWLSNAGLKNMLDPYENIRAGAIILGDLIERYGNSHKALMAYNFGEGGMKRVVRNGHSSSRYSRRVFEVKETLFNDDSVVFYIEKSRKRDISKLDMSLFNWCERWDLNPHITKIHAPQTCLSAYSSTLAYIKSSVIAL